MRYLSYIVFCLLFFVTCNKQPKELLPELSYAESLMQRCPDKALAVLDSMEVPSPSDKFQYATWCLFITQARDKNYIKHTSDSLINIALAYFEGQDDPQRKATTLYYEGRVNHDMDNADEATEFYLRARDVAEGIEDYKLLYLINSHLGSLYAYRNLADLALEAYEKAHNYSIQLMDSALISFSYSYLGRASALKEDWQKGLDFYKKAINIAEESKNTKALILATGEISTVYNAMSMLDSSIYYLKETMTIEEKYNCSSLPQTYLGIGKAYYFMSQFDSTHFYLDKALNTTNPYTKQEAIQILYYLCRDLGKLEDAIRFNEQYWICTDSIENINRSTKIAEIQMKYDQEKLLNINNRLENSVLWVAVISLFIICIVVLIYYNKLLTKKGIIEEKENMLQRRLAQLHENESLIEENENHIKALLSQLENFVGSQEHLKAQKEEIERIRQNNATLQTQKEILQEDIKKYIANLKEKGEAVKRYENLIIENVSLHERLRYLSAELINRINILNCLKTDQKFIKESQWPEIFDSMNIVYPNLIDRLRKDFSLSDSDVLLCCLIKLQLSNSIIAELVAITPSSVTKRKQRLKERINQHLNDPLGGETSIDTFLWKY